MELSKPSPLSILLAIIVVGQGAYSAYQSTKKTDTAIENFQKGSDKYETSTSYAPSATYQPLSFGCAPVMRAGNFGEVSTPIKKDKEKK